MTRNEIEERLHVVRANDQLYFDSIRAKLNANTREEAVAIAIRRRLISPGD